MKVPAPGRLPFLLLACSLALPSALAAQLQWQKVTGPEGGDIRGLTASGDTIMAATAQGDYYRSINGAKTWELLYRALATDFSTYGYWLPQPFFFGDRILGADAQAGLLLFQGSRAERILPEPELWGRPFRPTVFQNLGNRLFAVSEGIFASADSGKTWTLQTEFLGSVGPVSALVRDSVYLYGMNGGADLFASPDQGQTWSPILSDLGRDVSFGGLVGLPGGLLAWWQDGEVLKLTRQGALLSGSAGKLPGKAPWTVRYAGGKLVASGTSGISLSPDGGLTWTSLTDAPPLPIQTMAELPGGDFLAGTREGLYLWNRLTRKWSLSQSGLYAMEIRQLEKQGNSLLALGYNSLHRSLDGGASWHRVSAPGISGFTKMAILPPDILVFDDSGRVYPLGPGDTLGQDMTREFPAPPVDLGRSGKHWAATTASRETQVSHDDRKTWTSAGNSDPYHTPTRMAVSGSRFLIAGPKDSLRYSLDTGYTWKTIPTFPGLNFTQLALSGDAWLALGYKLYRSEDPSAGWQPVDVGPSGAVVQSLAGNGKTLYAATDIGLYASGDQGATWQSILTGMLRGEFETLKTGTTALFAKAENGTWWVAGLEETSPTHARVQATPSASDWPRVLRFQARSDHATLDFSLAARTRLYACPFAANGSRLEPAIRKEFDAGAHQWILPSLSGVVFWSIGKEGPGEKADATLKNKSPRP